ncbi:MAG: hypothetical protein ABSD46_00945 [Bacteroidota bacterium]
MNEEVNSVNNPNDKRNVIACFIFLVIGRQKICEIAEQEKEKTIADQLDEVHI